MDSQAYAEVYDIINHFELSMYNKIPQDIIDFIKKNKDDNYSVNLDYSKDLSSQNILKETRVILSVLYRDYICSENLRKKLKAYDLKEIENKKKINDLNNGNNIFEENDQVEKVEDYSKSKSLTEKKGNFIFKLINTIKRMFKTRG